MKDDQEQELSLLGTFRQQEEGDWQDSEMMTVDRSSHRSLFCNDSFRMRLCTIAAALVLFIFGVALGTQHERVTDKLGFLPSMQTTSTFTFPKQEIHADILDRGRLINKVTLAIPINKINDRACKSLFAMLINGYPAPHLLGLDEKFKTRLRKVFLLANFTKQQQQLQTDNNDNDKIFLNFDGFDVWPQLPLSILLQRYKSLTANNTKSKVIYGANKNCFPFKIGGEFCQESFFENQLQSDVYDWNRENQTDNQLSITDKAFRFPFMRARHLNGGTSIGHLKDAKVIYQEAEDIIRNGSALSEESEQGILIPVSQTEFGRETILTDWRYSLFAVFYRAEHEFVWVINPDTRTQATTASHNLKADQSRHLDLTGLDLDNVSSPWRNRQLAWH